MHWSVSVELIHWPVIPWPLLTSHNTALESVSSTSWTGNCLFCCLVEVGKSVWDCAL